MRVLVREAFGVLRYEALDANPNRNNMRMRSDLSQDQSWSPNNDMSWVQKDSRSGRQPSISTALTGTNRRSGAQGLPLSKDKRVARQASGLQGCSRSNRHSRIETTNQIRRNPGGIRASTRLARRSMCNLQETMFEWPKTGRGPLPQDRHDSRLALQGVQHGHRISRRLNAFARPSNELPAHCSGGGQ